MYLTARRASGLGQVDGWCIGEGIALLFSTPELRVLIDALALLIRRFEVLADPAPELAAAALGAIAELHGVQRAAIGFNRDLAQRAAKNLRGSGHGWKTEHNETLVSAPSVALMDQLQP